MKPWSAADSAKLYGVENWGESYFRVNAGGNLSVHPDKTESRAIDIMKVVDEIRGRGHKFPVLIRFQDIIRHRVETLNLTFRKVIAEAEYNGQYRGVYPIKVNQMREVVEEILDAGKPFDYGLEAGSKAELAAVVSMELSSESLVICNGYKDYDFCKTALLGLKLGKNVIIVVEQLSELQEVINVSRELNVRPMIGLRVKLSSKGSGKWEASSGDFAKFGLTIPEIVHVTQVLRNEGLEDCLKLLHFHIGSQITNIRRVNEACNEATRVYAKLCQMGFRLKYLDVGGGLGVDYDGSKTDFDSSTNYTLEEYVRGIVYSVKEVCDSEEVPVPTIVSESGRAVVAHHSVLLVDVFGSISMGTSPASLEPNPEEHEIVKQMRELLENLSNKTVLEHYHDAVQRKEDALSLFRLGYMSLEDRAKVERLFWEVTRKIHKHTSEMKFVPDDLLDLHRKLADQYLCNFSVFQSLLDHWSVAQLFPVMPVHKLTEQPSREAILVDTTCDSDGKICRFIDLRDIKDTLPVHALKAGDPYILGFFLVGAYQDIMGDLHNLFGRVNEVHVFYDESEPNGYYIEEVIPGNNVSEVLSWIKYSAHYLEKQIKEQIDRKVREGQIKPREGVDLLEFYEGILQGYTYVNHRRESASPKSAALPATNLKENTRENSESGF